MVRRSRSQARLSQLSGSPRRVGLGRLIIRNTPDVESIQRPDQKDFAGDFEIVAEFLRNGDPPARVERGLVEMAADGFEYFEALVGIEPRGEFRGHLVELRTREHRDAAAVGLGHEEDFDGVREAPFGGDRDAVFALDLVPECTCERGCGGGLWVVGHNARLGMKRTPLLPPIRPDPTQNDPRSQ